MSTDRTADEPRTPDAGHEPAGHDLDAWVVHLASELGIDPTVVDIQAVLDLASATAHDVARPAVPLTGFFVGYAVAAGTRDRAEFERVAERVTTLAQKWADRHDTEGHR